MILSTYSLHQVMMAVMSLLFSKIIALSFFISLAWKPINVKKIIEFC